MAKLRMQQYRCLACRHSFDELVELPDGAAMSMDSCPQSIRCGECGDDAVPVISAPRIMNTALPDGTDRGDTWKRAKEAAHLRRARRDLHPSKRGEIDREIASLNKQNQQRGKSDRFDPKR